MKRALVWIAAAGAGGLAAWYLWPRSRVPAGVRAASAAAIPPATYREVSALPAFIGEQEYKSKVDNLLKLDPPLIRDSSGAIVFHVNTYLPDGVPTWFRDVSAQQIATWGKRAAPLVKEVKTKESPAYKELYRGPWVLVFLYENGRWGWVSRNRYGQHAPGKSMNLWGAAAKAAGYVLPMVPGVGTAANVALQTTIALGQGKSMKDAVLAGMRGALPPWGQVAFDLGVGVAIEGKSVDAAAVDAGLNQLELHYPGARQAYQDGKTVAANVKG